MIKQSLMQIIVYALIENIEIHIIHVHKQKLLKIGTLYLKSYYAMKILDTHCFFSVFWLIYCKINEVQITAN